MALKRMISARGHPQHMYSDNAKYHYTYVVGALNICIVIMQNILLGLTKRLPKRLIKIMRSLKDFSEQLRFHWHYSVEYHSAGGGVWERMVKAIKVPLRKSLGGFFADLR